MAYCQSCYTNPNNQFNNSYLNKCLKCNQTHKCYMKFINKLIKEHKQGLLNNIVPKSIKVISIFCNDILKTLQTEIEQIGEENINVNNYTSDILEHWQIRLKIINEKDRLLTLINHKQFDIDAIKDLLKLLKSKIDPFIKVTDHDLVELQKFLTGKKINPQLLNFENDVPNIEDIEIDVYNPLCETLINTKNFYVTMIIEDESLINNQTKTMDKGLAENCCYSIINNRYVMMLLRYDKKDMRKIENSLENAKEFSITNKIFFNYKILTGKNYMTKENNIRAVHNTIRMFDSFNGDNINSFLNKI